MFCRIASFFCFSIYNRHHFLSEGGEAMKNKKVQSILNSCGIQTTFHHFPEYCGVILSKLFQIPLEQISENLEAKGATQNIIEEFSTLLDQYTLIFLCDYPEYQEQIMEDGKELLTFNLSSYHLKKGIIPANAVLIQMYFNGGKTKPETFLDSSCDDDRSDSDYTFVSRYFRMDYLYHCDMEIIKNSENLEYYFYPLVCYDRNILNDIYKDDELMLSVVEYIQELLANPYIDVC